MHRSLCLFLLSLCLCLGFSRVGYAQPSLVEEGLERYQQGDVLEAIALWQESIGDSSPTIQSESISDSITVRRYLVRAYQQVGQLSDAMATLEILADHYRQREERRQLGQMLTEQAQVYNELGQPQNALAVLCAQRDSTFCVEEDVVNNEAAGALALAVQQSDAKGQAAALGVLGQTYYLQGRYAAAMSALEASLEIARSNRYASYQVAANEALGNVQARLSQRSYQYAQFARQAQDSSETERLTAEAIAANQLAIDYFQQALETAQAENNSDAVLRSQLNLVIPTYRASESLRDANDLLARVRQPLAAMPASRAKVYASIRVASLTGQIQSLSRQDAPQKLLPISFTQCASMDATMVEPLQQAATIAREIKDLAAESYALGWLGHLYECEGDYSAAQQLSDRAQLLAAAPETRYLWEWQSGRILAAQGRATEAIALYERTVTTLKKVESNIAVASRDLRLDFRDTVESVYRQLTQLQIDQATLAIQPETRQNNPREAAIKPGQGSLLSALYALDGLRLAELRNYLGGECDLPLFVSPAQSLSPQLASISTLILDDRLAVILALPGEGGEIQTTLHEVPLGEAEIIGQVNDFRYALEQRSDRTNRYLKGSQQLYDWIVRPFESVLSDRNIQTIVFNHDGIFRSVPMAALYDGEQFLVEKYAISNSPSFAAVTPPLFVDGRLAEDDLQVLAFGLTDAASTSATESFSPLTAVATELSQIENVLPSATVLFNDEFTLERLRSLITESPFSILHLATHAQFGYDADDTFLVTGEKGTGDLYNQPLRLNALYRLLRNVKREQASPLQMLFLSACETAVGSERDALGIAGVAIQAGVDSAIASLWQVDDSATAELTANFYRYLQSGEDRSVALQTAQKTWLSSQSGGYRHPGYWAALVLVENGTS